MFFVVGWGMNTAMWRSSILLGALLSVIVALAVVLVGDRVPGVTLILAVFCGASVLGWANVERYRPALTRRR